MSWGATWVRAAWIYLGICSFCPAYGVCGVGHASPHACVPQVRTGILIAAAAQQQVLECVCGLL